ncbi:hypothetical protein GNP80_00155 [Aliivibrio fischeri]|uniref:hypothetical protein n=1 Tax=Aliivibrio fischeri TaxID=668 RepID=UPI0012D97F41|nr:hypothetical protein [Aliivibrio fischeri]MUK90866.1 hypothetical protein [Aliivibrio fischeri]
MTKTSLEEQFDNAMMNIYHRALSEAKYKAHIYFEMLMRHKGLGTAKKLINSPKVSSGYTALWELGRLDLTVEALIIENPIWHDLFSKEELNICHKRLCDYQYKPVINQ